ncbi:MAG: septum formation family protein [Nocardiopsaceae bacterium]|nr:septum formation family protein [Nocardiopsaceae bacterium]
MNIRRAFLGFVVVGATTTLTGCGLILNAAQEAASGGSGNDVGSGTEQQADAFTLEVGDCLNDESIVGEVEEIPTISCSEPHDSEVYATGTATGDEFPGNASLDAEAEGICGGEFEAFVGIPYEESFLGYSWYVPTQQSWDSGDRKIDCVIYDPEGQVTGSLRGSAR